MSELIDIAYNVNLETNLELNFDKAELEYYKEESVAELSIPLGNSVFTTRNGFEDETKVKLFIKTGFGGVSCSEVGIYSKRLVCSNGLVIKHGLNYFSCKHTERMNEKLKTFFSFSLPKMLTSTDDFTKVARKLDSKDITDDMIEKFRQSIFNYKAGDDISTKKQKMIEAFNLAMNEEMSRVGQTAWGLLQSATNYTNHRHPQAYKNVNEFVKLNTGSKINEKAEKFVLAI